MFPTKPNSFTRDAAVTVGGLRGPEPLYQLVDSGLLEAVGGGRYAVHQTIWEYAGSQAVPPRVPREGAPGACRFVRFYTELLSGGDATYELCLAESANILEAIRVGLDLKLRPEVIRCVNAFYPFIEARGAYLLDSIRSLMREAVDTTKGLRERSELGSRTAEPARIVEKEGNHHEADELLHEGLSIAKSVRRPERALISLIDLAQGIVEFSRCNYDVSAEQFTAALTSAERVEPGDRGGEVRCVSGWPRWISGAVAPSRRRPIS